MAPASIDRAGSNNRVRIEDQHEFAERLLDADVAGARKAEIRAEFRQADARPPSAHVGHGAIR